MKYPYITKILTVFDTINNTESKEVMLDNRELAIINSLEAIEGNKVIVFPEGTVLKHSFLEHCKVLQDKVDNNLAIESYDFNNKTYRNHIFPLSIFALTYNFSEEELENYYKESKDIISLETFGYKLYLVESNEKTENPFDFNKYAAENLDISTEAAKNDPKDQYFLNQNQIDSLLEMRTPKDIETKGYTARDWLVRMFSNQVEKIEKDGKIITKVTPPYMPLEGYFTLPKDTLPNQKEDILTTAGLYVFNMYVIAAAFKDKITYINRTMRSGDIGALNNQLAHMLLEDKIQLKDELEIYWNNLTFISYLTEMLMPGLPIEYLEEIPEVAKLKKELIKKYEKEIAAGDAAFYADHVEKPLLELAKEKMKDNPSWDIYDLGKKPSFGNNFKVAQLSVGPIRNPITDSYDIISNSYDEGVQVEKYHAYCNALIMGTYDRAKKTAYGGAQVKQLFSAMSNIVVDDAGTDCGTTRTYKMVLTKDTLKDYYYCYIKNPFAKDKSDLWLELTPDIISKFTDQTVELRTPLYCIGDKYCNKCMGNLIYRFGHDIRNAGLLMTIRPSSTLQQVSMKSFHDQSIKTVHVNLFDYMVKPKD